MHLLKGGMGIPTVKLTARAGNFNAMVTDLLGPSLEHLFDYCGRRFSLKTTLMLADQIIGRIEYLHVKNFLHRDVKVSRFFLLSIISCMTFFSPTTSSWALAIPRTSSI